MYKKLDTISLSEKYFNFFYFFLDKKYFFRHNKLNIKKKGLTNAETFFNVLQSDR